jgi:hypothetical protein
VFAAATYFKAANGNACSAGTAVSTLEDCKEAASELGYGEATELPVAEQDGRPPRCFFWDHSLPGGTGEVMKVAYFNPELNPQDPNYGFEGPEKGGICNAAQDTDGVPLTPSCHTPDTCVFPFEYLEVQYNSCTEIGQDGTAGLHPCWCSLVAQLTVDSSEWIYCDSNADGSADGSADDNPGSGAGAALPLAHVPVHCLRVHVH